jgi:PTH1 family peptidyl-tRNA hydrolase
MNVSGEAVKDFVKYYKIPLENVIIIYDDIDLSPSIVKIRKKGGAGTHNGMKSVVYELNSQEFPRVRVGTGMPENKSDLINYVIGKLSKEDYEVLETGISKGASAVEEILSKGIDNAMNIINSKN